MGFPSIKIAAVAPYTPPRPISFIVLLKFFDKLSAAPAKGSALFSFCGGFFFVTNAF